MNLNEVESGVYVVFFFLCVWFVKLSVKCMDEYGWMDEINCV